MTIKGFRNSSKTFQKSFKPFKMTFIRMEVTTPKNVSEKEIGLSLLSRPPRRVASSTLYWNFMFQVENYWLFFFSLAPPSKAFLYLQYTLDKRARNSINHNLQQKRTKSKPCFFDMLKCLSNDEIVY